MAHPLCDRSDIFSFGLALYEILSRRRAFTGDSTIAIMAAIVRDEPASLDATPAIRTIVARRLRKSPVAPLVLSSDASNRPTHRSRT